MSEIIGEYNRLIKIHRRKTGTDAANFPNQGWELFKSKWAKIKGQTGMATIKQTDGLAGAINAYSFRVYHDTTINESMRVEYKGVFYDIVTVRHDLAEREWTDIVCQVGGANG